ncbi:hypothetical protein [Nocardiopsis sp. L17-MgMaSL7]|uniref:hypothetical protein n=1 Tax=Nocardiopsis sp. L17-MgMaSL7 TaxID=1938893 RepID=UPI000D709F4B|nr:hypothetical protein [Nocardiopsis sp. L17-MgMaSL7]PWV55320.1 hypothetical protein BDW27_103324 [Nocardiopsis sp. L17-MgMaSL7]
MSDTAPEGWHVKLEEKWWGYRLHLSAPVVEAIEEANEALDPVHFVLATIENEPIGWAIEAYLLSEALLMGLEKNDKGVVLNASWLAIFVIVPTPGEIDWNDAAAVHTPTVDPRSIDTSAEGTKLRWTVFDGTRWGPEVAFPLDNVHSSGVAAAVYQDSLYCVHRGGGSDTALYWSRFDLNATGPGQKGILRNQELPGQRSWNRPALAVHDDGLLHCVYRSADESADLYETTFDGTSWSSAQTIKGQSSWTVPALASAGGVLHCLYRSADDSGTLYRTVCNEGTWQPAEPLRAEGVPTSYWSTNTPPSVAVLLEDFDARLYCAFTDRDSQELWCSSTRVWQDDWSAPEKIAGHRTSTGAGIASWAIPGGTSAVLAVSEALNNTALGWSGLSPDGGVRGPFALSDLTNRSAPVLVPFHPVNDELSTQVMCLHMAD